MRPSSLVLPLLLSLAACVTAPPVSPTLKLPPDTASVCASHCNSIGMDLGGVVIVRDSAGCVCQPRGAPPASAGAGSSAVVAGVAAVLDAEEADQESRRRSESHKSSSSGTKPAGSRR